MGGTLLITVGVHASAAIAKALVDEGLGPVLVQGNVLDGANRLLSSGVDHVVVLAGGELNSLRLLARAASRALQTPSVTVVRPPDTDVDLGGLPDATVVEAELERPRDVARAIIERLSPDDGAAPADRSPIGRRSGAPLPRAAMMEFDDDTAAHEDTFLEQGGAWRSEVGSSSSSPSSEAARFEEDQATVKTTSLPSELVRAIDTARKE